MKKILTIVILAAVIAASCNTAPRTDLGNANIVLADTTGLAQFQAWKTEQLAMASVKTDKVYTPARTHSSAARRTASRSTSYKTGSMSSESQYPAKAPKKGWSKAAKGAAIGAGSGAILGAVINKRNRAVGAVIGGVVGGGVGYGIGRSMDKKDGRY